MKARGRASLWTTAVLMGMALTQPALAQNGPYCPIDENGRISDVFYGGAQVSWKPLVEHERLVLTIHTPCSTLVREYERGEEPFFDLRDVLGEQDGTYTWELRAVPIVDPKIKKALTKSRETGNDTLQLKLQQEGLLPKGPFTESGAFEVLRGEIIPPGSEEEGSNDKAVAAVASGPMTPVDAGTAASLRRVYAADQVIPDDLIVQGSLCVGFDCVNNEAFSFDTIRMKENNLRIDFTDTSSIGGFPNQDWEIAANDSASGGRNALIVKDENTEIFVVESGNSANALYVDSTARVGLRTSNPVLDLHIATSNTPGIRLEQTSAGGFTAQTWDIAGNEANFFVRDVTGGSRLSFRIRPGAPTSSIDISGDGDVGIGTASPDAKLHVRGSDGGTDLLVEETSGTAATRTLITARNNGQTRFVIHNTNAATPAAGGYFFAHFDNGSFVVRPNGGGQGFFMDASGNITAEADLTVNGTFSNPSSRTLKEGFEPVDVQDVLQKISRVPITTWTYRSDAEKRQHIGPVVEDFQQAFGFGTEGKYIFPMDVQGVTLAALQGLNEKVVELETQRDRLQAELDELKTMIREVIDQR